jgi:hypothetical protein
MFGRTKEKGTAKLIKQPNDDVQNLPFLPKAIGR